MIAALTLAAALCTGPAFWTVDRTAPDCAPEAQLERCRCGEYLLWPAVDLADGYEIERCLAGTRFRGEFGRVRDCQIVGQTSGTEWYFVDDVPLDLHWKAGLFRYRVRSVRGEERSEWTAPVFYKRNPWPVVE